MKKYRKAKKGDITCADCDRSIQPKWPKNARLRCLASGGIGHREGSTVGRTMTCDKAKEK